MVAAVLQEHYCQPWTLLTLCICLLLRQRKALTVQQLAGYPKSRGPAWFPACVCIRSANESLFNISMVLRKHKMTVF